MNPTRASRDSARPLLSPSIRGTSLRRVGASILVSPFHREDFRGRVASRAECLEPRRAGKLVRSAAVMLPEKKQILVVDDEANLRKVLSAQLARDGYEVHTAEDGEAGL